MVYTNTEAAADIAALQFYLDQGANEFIENAPVNRFTQQSKQDATNQPPTAHNAPIPATSPPNHQPKDAPTGKSDAQIHAAQQASAAQTLEDLRTTIAEFDAHPLKKTATNLVFDAGNPQSTIMLIGDAPATEEDRQGQPFVGDSGKLLDKILKCIDLNRNEEEQTNTVYLANILNWRPPGNRAPSPNEIAISLPFIERQIQLAQPKILVLCGGDTAKALLGKNESISRLRKKWHEYRPQTPELQTNNPHAIATIVTYHPSYLLNTPMQKKSVWADMLEIQQKLHTL